MPNISIKDVPEQWAEALRRRAARNHRSLQGELMFLIEQAVQGGSAGANPEAENISEMGANRGASRGVNRGPVAGFDRRGYPMVRTGWKTVEQVVAEMNAKFPEPVSDVPLGVDIIRADRDSR